MSLPLTRRIARAALLVAAGAAPMVGAAGSASAMDLTKKPDLGALTAVDPGSVADAVDDTTQGATEVAGETGGETVKHAVPAAGKAAGGTVKKATPAAQKIAGDTAGNAGDLLGDTAKSATESELTGSLPMDALGEDMSPQMLADGLLDS
ncbi:ATP-binding protein [Streptomyces sp. MST-110588]|uniref:ATP-binding protein n=1 Tax=Streptomyces sp. MST-110588 TaxID=2833628 RepID=UPI001F5CC5FB|nr:ATP-binding protein [Streptomyces sp. MST-110588]UNO40080.1 ATP-binding protein [Streptomyces sp. MST-110588]